MLTSNDQELEAYKGIKKEMELFPQGGRIKRGILYSKDVIKKLKTTERLDTFSQFLSLTKRPQALTLYLPNRCTKCDNQSKRPLVQPNWLGPWTLGCHRVKDTLGKGEVSQLMV